MGGGGTKPPRGPVTPVLRKKGSGPAARAEGASRRSCLLVVVRGGAGAPCDVRCEPLTLLNRHFSDSDGGADRTVGKLSVMRVWWLVVLHERFHRISVGPQFLKWPSHILEDPDM